MESSPEQEVELLITTLGGLGDGIGYLDGRVVFVPHTAPGDRVRVRLPRLKGEHAEVLEILESSGERNTPPCSHFGQCGGCSLQHLSSESYRQLKEERVALAVCQAGYATDSLRPMVEATSGRRRVEFAVRVEKSVVTLGYQEAGSHRAVDLAMCPSSAAPIEASITPLRQLIASLKKPGSVKRLTLTLVDQGLDLLLHAEPALLARDRALLIAAAASQGWARMSVQGSEGLEILVDHGATLAMGGVPVELPPAAFLQATAAGEQALVERVRAGVGGARRIADLYAGLGTYSLPLLAAGREVSAYEGSAALMHTLWNAAHGAGFGERLNVTTRDLFQAPVGSNSLKGFDAVVINPPRNGASPQIDQIARAKPKVVMMVSCNPATFARDAMRLREADYALTEITPVDQFRWTPHIELVARFAL